MARCCFGRQISHEDYRHISTDLGGSVRVFVPLPGGAFRCTQSQDDRLCREPRDVVFPFVFVVTVSVGPHADTGDGVSSSNVFVVLELIEGRLIELFSC